VGVTGCKKGTNNNTTPPVDTKEVKYTLAESADVKAGTEGGVTLKREGPEAKLTAQDVTVTVKGNDKVTATATKFEAKKTESKITINAKDAEPGDATLEVEVGGWKGTLKLKVTKGAAGAGKATYTLDKDDVAVAAGKSVEVKVTREGGKMDAKTLEIAGATKESKLTVTGGEFEKDGKEATITIAADKKAPDANYTLKFKAGGKEHTIKVKVGKGAAEGRLNLPRGDYLAQSRRVEALPQVRVSFTRQVALFTREF
jgi:uncharacterized protein YxeA